MEPDSPNTTPSNGRRNQIGSSTARCNQHTISNAAPNTAGHPRIHPINQRRIRYVGLHRPISRPRSVMSAIGLVTRRWYGLPGLLVDYRMRSAAIRL